MPNDPHDPPCLHFIATLRKQALSLFVLAPRDLNRIILTKYQNPKARPYAIYWLAMKEADLKKQDVEITCVDIFVPWLQVIYSHGRGIAELSNVVRLRAQKLCMWCYQYPISTSVLLPAATSEAFIERSSAPRVRDRGKARCQRY